MSGQIATANITIAAPVAKVWEALTNPALIKEYLYGSEVVSDWQVGSPIVYKGEWQGKPYEDKGTILEIEPNKLLKSTHYSPLSGAEDKPENYHTLTYTLSEADGQTAVTLTQDNNASAEEVEHSTEMWNNVLQGMKKVLEK
jgi:uncharacterized protein YndB with AHSA1/START domain